MLQLGRAEILQERPLKALIPMPMRQSACAPVRVVESHLTCAMCNDIAFPCRGVLPAVSGQFVSHGLRTFAFEGSLTGLKAISGGAAELQVGLLSNS